MLGIYEKDALGKTESDQGETKKKTSISHHQHDKYKTTVHWSVTHLAINSKNVY